MATEGGATAAAAPAAAPEAEAVPVTPPEGKHLILVDGSGYIFRAFHALPPMNNPAGVPVNAVFGFTQMISRFLLDHRGSHIAVVFDASRTTFRNELYPDYKAHRPDPPPELVPQFALIREATDALGVCKIEQPGYEADDMIAAYARAFEAEGGRVTIVSSDKDLMQLVRPGVEMLDPIKQKPIREAEVAEKFGVPPEKVADVQALAGDPTDNVPGVPGIGVKTAAQLIHEYGSVEALLDNAGKIKQPKRREALLANREQALVSKRLVALDADAPLPAPVETLEARPPERANLEKFLRAQGFRSVLARLGFGEASGVAGTRARHSAVAALQRWIAEAQRNGIVAFDTETDSLDALRATLLGVSLATAPGRACYVPFRHGKSGDM